jgi:hypothetical protein
MKTAPLTSKNPFQISEKIKQLGKTTIRPERAKKRPDQFFHTF